MKEFLKIDNNINIQENYEVIQESIQRLTNASQEQFESIKKEKWYNRLFDMITFSQKGKKRLAEQISTLAQAQQIFIEFLLRLSEDDTKISALVLSSMTYIRKLSEQDIYLQQKINRLESICLGIKPNMDINSLTLSEKQLLSALIYKLCNNAEQPSETQKTYANHIIEYIDADIQMDNPLLKLNEINTDSKRKILTCCMEYIFLKNNSFDNFDNYNNIITEFDFGSKTIESVKEQITTLFNCRGFEGFISKYKIENYLELEDEFFSVFDEKDNKEIINTVIEFFGKYYEKLCETTNFILLGYSYSLEQKTPQYCIINKNTGVCNETEMFNQTYLIKDWVTFDDTAFTISNQKVYQVNLEELKVTELSVKLKDYNKLLAATNDYLVLELKENSRGEVCLFDMNTEEIKVIRELYYPKFVIPYKTGFIFKNGGTLEYYKPETNNFILMSEDTNYWQSGYTGISYGYILNDKLFILSFGISKKYQICVVDLSDEYKIIHTSDGLIYDYVGSFGICENGFYFIGETSELKLSLSPSFDLMFFSFENMNKIMLANDCGHYIKEKKGIFKKTDKIYSHLYGTTSIGTNIIVKKDYVLDSKYLIIDSNKPTIVNYYK